MGLKPVQQALRSRPKDKDLRICLPIHLPGVKCISLTSLFTQLIFLHFDHYCISHLSQNVSAILLMRDKTTRSHFPSQLTPLWLTMMPKPKADRCKYHARPGWQKFLTTFPRQGDKGVLALLLCCLRLTERFTQERVSID